MEVFNQIAFPSVMFKTSTRPIEMARKFFSLCIFDSLLRRH